MQSRHGWWVPLAVVGAFAACGEIRSQPSSDAQKGDAVVDDAPPMEPLSLTASPSSFRLHAYDTRETKVTVTNRSTQTIGTPSFQASGLTLGTMTLSENTCTSDLAPGASCTAIGTLTATTPGDVEFQITAMASGVTATATLSASIMTACPSTCGPAGSANCCASAIVPGNATGAALAGASFYRSWDVAADTSIPKDMDYPAAVSDFRLDKYEVTVGRFRAFVNAGYGTQAKPPMVGSGSHSAIPDSGWNPAWNAYLAASTATLKDNVKCSPTYQSWTDTAGANENLPINCIDWYTAMAFCIWDGGYLPTEAELNYAEAGGSEQRAYPWSSPASSIAIDCGYANYKGNNPAGTYCVNGTTGGLARVGATSPKGDGKWGHSDLGGNVYEWSLDWYATSYPTVMCTDCANLTAGSSRVVRGGSFFYLALDLRTALRNNYSPDTGWDTVGVRCARTP